MRYEEEQFIIEQGRNRSIAIRFYSALITAFVFIGGAMWLVQATSQ